MIISILHKLDKFLRKRSLLYVWLRQWYRKKQEPSENTCKSRWESLRAWYLRNVTNIWYVRMVSWISYVIPICQYIIHFHGAFRAGEIHAALEAPHLPPLDPAVEATRYGVDFNEELYYISQLDHIILFITRIFP